ncbi:hypothetical protein AB0B28_15985 [Glycomyces sp. NPDC046736]|uniref:hypothetical protein n=1 Tax=Glycomyces sp. NPDC046736 TaxID=3155615 RepID=UPI0033D97BE2
MANVDEFSNAILAVGEAISQADAAGAAAVQTGEELTGQFQMLGIEDKTAQTQAVKDGIEQVRAMLQAAKDAAENLAAQAQALKG